MNAKHLIVVSLAGGLISTVLVNTPFVSLVNLLVCAGFWIGPIAAVGLYRRISGAPTMGQAVVLGIVAGLWHGVFGLILSALGLAGAGSLLNDLRAIVPAADLPDLETTLTGVGGLLFNLAGVAVDVVFGFMGGLLGGAIFGARRTAV